MYNTILHIVIVLSEILAILFLCRLFSFKFGKKCWKVALNKKNWLVLLGFGIFWICYTTFDILPYIQNLPTIWCYRYELCKNLQLIGSCILLQYFWYLISLDDTLPIQQSSLQQIVLKKTQYTNKITTLFFILTISLWLCMGSFFLFKSTAMYVHISQSLVMVCTFLTFMYCNVIQSCNFSNENEIVIKNFSIFVFCIFINTTITFFNNFNLILLNFLSQMFLIIKCLNCFLFGRVMFSKEIEELVYAHSY